MQLEDIQWEFAGGMIAILVIYLAMMIPLVLILVYGNCKDEEEEE